MSSKIYKRNFEAVSKNFEKYAQAMESDLQILISSVLDIIEAKITMLRRLLKVKLCLKKVKSLAGLECGEDVTETDCCDKNNIGSLEDLSSAIYEIDKNSLPIDDHSLEESKARKRTKYLEKIVDLESLCLDLNGSKKKDTTEDEKSAFDKYIYLLLDSERKKQDKKETKSSQQGDCYTKSSVEIICPAEPNTPNGSMVLLERTQYESILDILNMVLKSYKMQEKTRKNKIIEKTRTEPTFGSNVCHDERKIMSDNICHLKDDGDIEKRPKSRKFSCL